MPGHPRLRSRMGHAPWRCVDRREPTVTRLAAQTHRQLSPICRMQAAYSATPRPYGSPGARMGIDYRRSRPAAAS